MMKTKQCLSILSLIVSLGYLSTAMAALSPEGNWKTMNTVTHKERSILQLSVVNGVLNGKIIKIFPEADDNGNGTCDKCTGEFKGKKILGMQVLWGLKQTADLVWQDGKILDPKSGKIYNCKLTLNPDGKTLQARIFQAGMTLIGRSQIWIRVT